MLEWMEESSGRENNSLNVAYSCPLTAWASMSCCEFFSSNTPSFYNALSPRFDLGTMLLNDMKRSLSAPHSQELLLDICKVSYLMI
jgi:hypothetical protein